MNRNVVTAMLVALFVCLSLPIFAEDSNLIDEEQKNKEIIEWLFDEGLNKHNPDVWDSVLSPDYVRYCDAMPPGMQVLRGVDLFKGFLAEHFAAFPDWNEQILQMVVENDKIAIVSIGTGTMTGGFGPFKATGKRVKITDIMIHRFKDGKIVESWVTWDNLNFMAQAGLTIPPPPPVSKPDSSSN